MSFLHFFQWFICCLLLLEQDINYVIKPMKSYVVTTFIICPHILDRDCELLVSWYYFFKSRLPLLPSLDLMIYFVVWNSFFWIGNWILSHLSFLYSSCFWWVKALWKMLRKETFILICLGKFFEFFLKFENFKFNEMRWWCISFFFIIIIFFDRVII